MNRRCFLRFGAAIALATTATLRGRSLAAQTTPSASSFRGRRAGDERVIEGVAFRWCPPGRFRMGSPVTEKNRRPDEGPVAVTLTRAHCQKRPFWLSHLSA